MRVLLLTAAAILAACGGEASTLDPAGPRAERVATLTWTMTALGIGVYVLVMAALFVAIRRSGRGRPLVAAPSDERIIVGGGILLPALVIPLLWVLTLREAAATIDPPAEPALTVEVTAHQWWYEVRYPDHAVTVTGEMRIPAGRVVRLIVTSDDVIHSFWVPRLSGKIDMIPGRSNESWVQADLTGRYSVVCAEFCGIGHALMRMDVLAEAPADFERWLASQRSGP
jgi:cytochrome c oxidase subunit 2